MQVARSGGGSEAKAMTAKTGGRVGVEQLNQGDDHPRPWSPWADRIGSAVPSFGTSNDISKLFRYGCGHETEIGPPAVASAAG